MVNACTAPENGVADSNLKEQEVGYCWRQKVKHPLIKKNKPP